jgi:hypothetical protein
MGIKIIVLNLVPCNDEILFIDYLLWGLCAWGRYEMLCEVWGERVTAGGKGWEMTVYIGLR